MITCVCTCCSCAHLVAICRAPKAAFATAVLLAGNPIVGQSFSLAVTLQHMVDIFVWLISLRNMSRVTLWSCSYIWAGVGQKLVTSLQFRSGACIETHQPFLRLNSWRQAHTMNPCSILLPLLVISSVLSAKAQDAAATKHVGSTQPRQSLRACLEKAGVHTVTGGGSAACSAAASLGFGQQHKTA
jgi:hypothetical protein